MRFQPTIVPSPKSQRYGDLDPVGNEFGGFVQLALIALQSSPFLAVKAGLWDWIISARPAR